MDNLIQSIEPTSCSCTQCKLMCFVSPCFPTPEDVDKLIKAGYEDSLMKTRYIDLSKMGIYDVIAPKSIPMLYDKPDGTTIPLNKCVFLNKDSLCSLHDKGLKPTEGRLAKCNQHESKSVELRIAVSNTWKDSELGNKIFEFYE